MSKAKLFIDAVLKTSIWSGLCLLWNIGCPNLAFSLQLHGDPEGLYVHQIAHFFFVISMTILIYWLFRMKLLFQRGWRFIGLGATFLILWNIDAFVGHWIEGTNGVNMIVKGNHWSGTIEFPSLSENMAVLYYLLKLDHLLCVPAIASIFLGLRELYTDSVKTLRQRQES